MSIDFLGSPNSDTRGSCHAFSSGFSGSKGVGVGASDCVLKYEEIATAFLKQGYPIFNGYGWMVYNGWTAGWVSIERCHILQ